MKGAFQYANKKLDHIMSWVLNDKSGNIWQLCRIKMSGRSLTISNVGLMKYPSYIYPYYYILLLFVFFLLFSTLCPQCSMDTFTMKPQMCRMHQYICQTVPRYFTYAFLTRPTFILHFIIHIRDLTYLIAFIYMSEDYIQVKNSHQNIDLHKTMISLDILKYKKIH